MDVGALRQIIALVESQPQQTQRVKRATLLTSKAAKNAWNIPSYQLSARRINPSYPHATRITTNSLRIHIINLSLRHAFITSDWFSNQPNGFRKIWNQTKRKTPPRGRNKVLTTSSEKQQQKQKQQRQKGNKYNSVTKRHKNPDRCISQLQPFCDNKWNTSPTQNTWDLFLPCLRIKYTQGNL